MYNARAQISTSNPSVMLGSQTALNGPRVSAIKFPIYTSDSAALGSVLSGTNQIMDYPPADFTQTQTALSTNFLNVTEESGSSQENIIFNMHSAKDPGFYLAYRQAIAHLIKYSYIQSTVLSGVLGQATPNIMLPAAFGAFATNNIQVYQNSLTLANQSLAQDPQIAWNPTQVRPSSSNTIACDGTTKGVWDYATAVGSHTPNGTVFEPNFITRPDHPEWLTFATKLWSDAASIGLCLSLQQVVHFSNVFPIIYAQYSDNWGMYDGGTSFSSPLNPISYLFLGFTKAPGWSNPFDNTEQFYNATIETVLHDMFGNSSINLPLAENLSQRAVQMLQQQIPQVDLWWDSVDIPSLNSYHNSYWTGFVDVPAFSSWSIGSSFWTSLNAHMFDPSTGKTIVGGTLGVTMHEAPDDFNGFQATSVYDLDIINDLGFFDTAVVGSPANPTLSGLIPWMTNGMPTVTYNVNLTTPHGYRMVDGSIVTFKFLDNITWTDNVPFTASDFNFTLWYENANAAVYNSSKPVGPFGFCSTPCWQRYVNDSSAIFTGTQPDLIDSVVNSTTTATVYENGSSILDYEEPAVASIYPQHIWANVNSSAFNADPIGVNPAATNAQGLPFMIGQGPFYFQSYVPNQYVLITRNPGYFRTDIKDWAISGSGSSVPLSINLTQMGTPIPSSAIVKAWVVQNGSPVSTSTTSLTLTGGSWKGNLNTGGLSQGFYEIVVNGTYTDSHSLAHTALQFWGLNLGTSGQSSSASSSTTGPSTSSTSTGAPSPPPSPPSSTNVALVAGVVIVIIIIAATAAYLVRRR